ncbi:TetR/AcrR family transcriptional regulator [Amycolatopsis lurida]
MCRAAGVSKRSLYQLFESKDELLAACLKEGAAPFRGESAAVGRRCPSTP